MTAFPYRIRPIRPEKDAAEIATLIRTCFAQWLDDDNISYLNQMKEAGLSAKAHPLWTDLTGFPYDIKGIVCVDRDEKILGVINTYGFQSAGRKCCLYANVCTDPAHRNEGIADNMLREADRIQKANGISDIYLQARAEKPEIISFYRKHAFRVTDYRENWVHPRTDKIPSSGSGFSLERVPKSDEERFRQFFGIRYPSSILWNLDYHDDLFRFGLSGEIVSRLTSGKNRFQRIIDQEGKLIAWCAYQHLNSFADALWFIPNGDLSEREITDALLVLQKNYHYTKPLKLDSPMENRSKALSNAGFVLLQRLAWMWKKL